MCGLYNLTDSPWIQNLLKELGIELDLPKPRYHIRPTDSAPVLYRNDQGELAIKPMRWWLLPPWADSPNWTKAACFNFKWEDAPQKKTWAPLLGKRNHHGVALASSFYEREQLANGKAGRRFHIQPANTQTSGIAFAALWREWQPPQHGTTAEDTSVIASFAIGTQQPSADFAQYHNRMPVILTPSQIIEYLNPEQSSQNYRDFANNQIPFDIEVSDQDPRH